jgi:hypothetical protein
MHRKIVDIVSFTPQDCTTTTCSLVPTRPQTGNLPARSQEASRFAVRRFRRSSPADFRVPFPCAIRSRSPVLHAVHPCCDALTPAAISCACARARPLRVCLLPPSHTPSSSAQTRIRHFRCTGTSPEGHAQENAPGVRPSPGLAGFGAGLPGIPARTTATLPARRKRHSEIGHRRTAFKSVLLCVAIPEAGLSPQSSPGANTLLMRPEYGSQRR